MKSVSVATILLAAVSFASAHAVDANVILGSALRAQEVQEVNGRKRYLISNCVIETSTSISIVSQVSDEEGARRLDAVTTCIVEVTTTVTFGPGPDSLDTSDRGPKKDKKDPKVPKDLKLPKTKKVPKVTKTKGPKTKGPKCSTTKTKGPNSKGLKTKGMKRLRRDLKGGKTGLKVKKTKAPGCSKVPKTKGPKTKGPKKTKNP